VITPADSSVPGDYAGPTHGADRAVLLAHGAGSDRNAPVLVAMADALATAGIPSLRFDYPYRAAGRRAPDRPAKLEAATREAAAELALRSGVPPDRLVLGGRSMGGRIGSVVVGAEVDPVPSLGLLLLGYPLHPAGKPERTRDEHFPRLDVPVLFVSGTRDALAPQADLTRCARKVRGPVTLHWIDAADHGYRPLKSSGRTPADVVEEVVTVSLAWVQSLGKRRPNPA
jgi:uncharacterized protein